LEVSLLNQDDATHRPIMNPKITVESSLDFINFHPQPTIANPPTYIWTHEELPENDVWGVAAILESEVPLKPRFSASRSVTPEYLVEEEIIQTFVVTFILEEELPADMTTIGVYIGFTPGDYAKVKETVEYTLVEQKPTEDWEVDAVGYVGQPVAKWNTLPFMVDVGRTYQFEATFKVRKTQASLSPLISKPGVQILYSKISFEVPVVGKSTSIEVSDINITFEADEEIAWSERCVTTDLYDFWFNPVISSPEGIQERNQAGARILNRWEYWTAPSDDRISNVPQNWVHDWFFVLENWEDPTHKQIINPNINVESSLSFVDYFPQPTTYVPNPPTYSWTRKDLIDGDFWPVSVKLDDVVLKPRFSASHSVTPDYLVEEETIQTVVTRFTLEEELPPGMTAIWVYMGFGHLYYEMNEIVKYTVDTQVPTEGWEMGVVGPPNWPGVEWHTTPFNVELGRTYQFEATFKVNKVQAGLGSFICKPGFQIVYEKGSGEVPIVDKSVTIEVPDIKVTFEADEEVEWNSWVSSDHYEVWIAPMIPSPEFPPVTTLETTVKTTTETPPETTTPGIGFIPGFELFPAIAAILVALYLTRRKNS